MNELLEHYELVKEIKMIFDNVETKITGKIYKIIKGATPQYTWEISHYCRLKEEVDVYIPGAPFGDTKETTERALLNYLNRFENATDWRENKYF